MIIRIILALTLFAVPLSHTFSQDRADLDKLDDKFTKYFERVMPGWKHKRVSPVYDKENVLIQFWYGTNRSVKIAVAPHKTAEEAREVFRQSKAPKKEVLSNLGDEGYAWGYGSSTIVFRKGRYMVYVSTYAEVDSDPDAGLLTQEQRFEREKNEMRRLSMEFAKHAVKATDVP